ncbi:YIF1-domain-containing protein [Yarrowia lipolytica]|jgi:hypothetical protein|uniref:Protein YIF1 n=2 Tax=Yarrowia lipolytica TaxID=4952 RepID=Q6C4J2_YARLI|nr:YALI0E26323p [Yarrowia lipolytica CLIB122]AOW05988.1 hypothetical protein YALI1_E31194g [Yarrowia lipolytica]KAB8280639.1 YIF1-domain-containing protein [Yarrowia lipolytica]KAE8170534.1 YIF1-domain-containing protein [Yarrowia lipolytica]KAJ8057395.1 YIF1-domain-containing protein [Yarrowia lipolytica]QNP99209.1 Protein transport protein yif1 [Yarrowia lipolytica]|eukprot:XP_504420.1 YALI0E26323p [Yarrowia lipolytica CLIB122]
MYNQRQGNTATPPLHHPIPQHPIPPMRSPPVEQTQHQNLQDRYAPPQQHAQHQQHPQHGAGGDQGNFFNPAGYPQFFNDGTAQVGLQVGRSAVAAGQEYMEKNFNKYVSVSQLRYYFQVSNLYVVKKLGLVLFPFLHKPWTRDVVRSETTGEIEGYAPARDDINAPDMYIPTMAFTTYIILCSVLSGVHDHFHPQLFGTLASKAVSVMVFELLVLRLATYLLSADSQLFDFAAYAGYKLVGVLITILAASLTGSTYVKWGVFLYTYIANAMFLLRSIKYLIIPDGTSPVPQGINTGNRRSSIQFLAVYAFLFQLGMMWILIPANSVLNSAPVPVIAQTMS